MSENRLKVETNTGTLDVYATAKDESGVCRVYTCTPYDQGNPQPLTANGVEYIVSVGFTLEEVNGHPRCVYSYIRRPGWGKDTDKVSSSAHRKIMEACEYAFRTFLATVGQKAFVDAECEDLRYHIKRLREEIAEKRAKEEILAAKLAQLEQGTTSAPAQLEQECSQ